MISYLRNVCLQDFNTFRIPVYGKKYVAITKLEQIPEVFRDASQSKEDLIVLGGGSNVLFIGDIDAIVLHMQLKGIECIDEDDDYIFIKAMAGESWHRFVCYCVEKGYGGLENLSLIPGTVGSAPVQNIGAYGVEVQDCFHELEACERNTGKMRTFVRSECAFGYRDSIFKKKLKDQYVITAVTFRLAKKPQFLTSYDAIEKELVNMGVKRLSLHAVSEAICSIRRRKLPDIDSIGSAGSFFKNPFVSCENAEDLLKKYPKMPLYQVEDNRALKKLSAAWLIEECGWKGFRRGDAGVHKDHALVLVNYGNATGEEILTLARGIRKSVLDTFGIALEPEVNIYPPTELM